MDQVKERPQQTNVPVQADVGISLIKNTDVDQMAQQLQAISNFQGMVEKNLTNGQDYGVIPGTQKPTLLKPGAKKIQMLMGVTSEYDVIDKGEDYTNVDYKMKTV